MKYNLNKPLDARQAQTQLKHLIAKGARIELTEKRAFASLPQMRYVHLILSSWGAFLGYTTEEMKQMVKQSLPNIYQYKKKAVTFYKSFADVDSKEMTITIDWIRDTASKQSGYYIPAPNEEELLLSLQNEAERKGF